MYKELVTALRYCATHPCMGEGQAIAHCEAVWAEDDRFDDCGSCGAVLQMQAADAIEELQKDLERSKDFEAFWQQEAEEALRKYQVAISRKPQWIPVTERLPDLIHEYVLCCGSKGGQFVGWVSTGKIVNGRAMAFSPNGKGRYITHWMPLPEPPTQKEET